MQTSFSDNDYEAYIDLIVQSCSVGTPPYFHLIAVPPSEEHLGLLMTLDIKLYGRLIFKEVVKGAVQISERVEKKT